MTNEKPLKNMSGSIEAAARIARTYDPSKVTSVKDTNGEKFKLYNIAEDDYPELEGKIIKYNSGMASDKIETGIVVGCNTSVGITVVNAHNKDEYFVCYTGPTAPGGSNIADWDQGIWEFLINCINDGLLVGRDLIKYDPNGERYISGCPDGSMCAYNQ